MLVSSFETSLIFPDVKVSDKELDIFVDGLFSEEEKRPFTETEKDIIKESLTLSKHRIKEKFQVTEEHQLDIEQKIDYLNKKLNILDRFNWKRLFIATLVGISVDLGMGTTVTTSLISAFKEIVTHYVYKSRKFLKKDG